MHTPQQLLDIFNQALAAMPLDRQPRGLYDPVRYVLSLGGKRIRPVLMLMAYELYRDDIESIMPIALGIETYHNYTLLHDDVMDRADVRRGKPTVHRVWDDNSAILSGDAMLVLAYQLMSQARPQVLKDVLDLFTTTALEIGEGQQYDMEFEKRLDVSEQEYIEMIRLKTSVLLACALKLGAMQAGAPDADSRHLYAFGEHLGLAFQLQDDLLDVYGDFATFGKRIGGDILEGKKTFMLINALRLATDSQRADLEAWLQRPTDGSNPLACQAEEKIAAVTAVYDAVGVRQLAEAKIAHYFDAALDDLEAVALPSERKQPLLALSRSLMGRQS
ncbi:MAG: polyprenyl synthetase family protein [Bacteroidaceae bacterium]|nr:polyprenyl synthetase family protein [Bacteroidaceae bacterium]